jgi:hypothetical protein
MRLLRDRIPGVGHRYIQFAPEQLVPELEKHSPIALARKVLGGQPNNHSDGEKNALPVVVQTQQPRAECLPEAKIDIGGDGGGFTSL